MTQAVNVIIPVYKPDNKLIKLIEKMNVQTIRPSQIIFMSTRNLTGSDEVDERDKDGLKVIDECLKLSEIKLNVIDVDVNSFDHGGTRALGRTYIDGDCEYILYMTQDAVPNDEKLIENLLEPFSDNQNSGEKIGVCYGRQLPAKDSSLAEKFTRGFNYPDEDRLKTFDDIEKIGIKAFFCSNVCAMYRVSVYDELGGFIKKTIFNEDMVFANKVLKSGYAIYYASKAGVIHTHNYNGMQQYKRNFDLAISQTLNPQAFKGVSSESEGVRYVMAAFKYFLKHLRPFLIIPFGINCVYKLLGYKKGQKIAELSESEVMKCTSNKGFFRDLKIDSSIVETVMTINGIREQ